MPGSKAGKYVVGKTAKPHLKNLNNLDCNIADFSNIRPKRFKMSLLSCDLSKYARFYRATLC